MKNHGEISSRERETIEQRKNAGVRQSRFGVFYCPAVCARSAALPGVRKINMDLTFKIWLFLSIYLRFCRKQKVKMPKTIEKPKV